MAITAFPLIPARNTMTDTAYVAAVDSLLSKIPAFVTETNAVAATMNFEQTNATSITDYALALGNTITLTATVNKSFQLGMYLVLADTAAPTTNSMYGQVVSYNTANGALVVNVLSFVGVVGTNVLNWTISQSAPLGASDLRYILSSADGSSGNLVVVVDADIVVGKYLVKTSQSGKYFRANTSAAFIYDLPLPSPSTSPPPAGTNYVFFGHADFALTVQCDGGTVGIAMPHHNTQTDALLVNSFLVAQGLGNEAAVFYDGVRWRVITFGATHVTGIQFPAVQDPSTDPNTLDDYEEGVWTPSVGGTATYGAANAGTYTKIGRQVTASFRVDVTLLGTGSSNGVTGLPFSNGPQIAVGYVAQMVTVGSFVSLGLVMGASSNTIIVQGKLAAATSDVATNVFGDATRLSGCIVFNT